MSTALDQRSAPPSRDLLATLHSYFDAKSSRDVARTMRHFRRAQTFYGDTTLGRAADYAALEQVFSTYMPMWGETARSYGTRVLGDGRSAVVFFTNSPELFGAELRAAAAVDFHEGEICRWVDYWDGRHFGLDATAKMRTPQAHFPADFQESAVGEQAAEQMRTVAQRLCHALSSGDAAAAGELFAVDAVLEDVALRTQVPGRLAIHRYLSRALPSLPFGVGSSLRHVLGGERAGGYEWSGTGAVRHGITGLELDAAGRITRLTAMWDGSQLDERKVASLMLLAVER